MREKLYRDMALERLGLYCNGLGIVLQEGFVLQAVGWEESSVTIQILYRD